MDNKTPAHSYEATKLQGKHMAVHKIMLPIVICQSLHFVSKAGAWFLTFMETSVCVHS